MRKLSHLELNIKIDRPLESVWNSLVDWRSQSEWMLQTKVWSELDQDRTIKNGKGVLIFAFTGLFPKLYPKLRLGILDTMEITAFKPPVLCEVVHIGRVIRGTGRFKLIKTKKGTIFNWQENLIAPAIFLIVMKPVLLLGVWLSLRRFARLLTR
ncbi:MAG: SRPBCC family protein [Actinobacteria bacterium]|nr:SRPBCC family protein [Actinomycetota bacterium]